MEGSFVGNKCFFYHKGQLVLTGERAAKTMYYLKIGSKDSKDFANSAQRIDSLLIWHQRLGHADSRNIRRMFTMNLVEGLKLGTTESDNRISPGCAKGKMHRLPFQISTSPKADHIAERIHSNVCGPMSYTSLGGASYFVIFKDEFSGWIVINFMKMKSEVLIHLQSLFAFLKNQTGYTIQTIRTDNGTEYVNVALSKWTTEMGIRHETSVIYTPEQNGTSERTNRTIMESAKSMMFSSNAPLWLWAEAAGYSTYIRNRIASGQKKLTPFEVLHNRKPNVSHIKTFGSKTFVHISDVKRKKLEPKCIEGYLVGYCESTKGYRVYIPDIKKVIISRDVIIDESVVGFNASLTNKSATDSFVSSVMDPFTELVNYIHYSSLMHRVTIL